MKEKIVAVVARTTHSIDFTPIHYFETVKPIRSGSIIRWDEAEQKLVLDDEAYKGRDDIED